MNKGIKNEILIASTVLFLIISISTISVASAGPNDLTTSEGNVVSHYDLIPDPTGTDTIQVYQPKIGNPKQGENTHTLREADPDTSNLNNDDGDVTQRTEDWTAAEKMQLDNGNLEFFPGIIKTNDATKAYNCHSFTFDKSMQWLGPSTPTDPGGQKAVALVIADQGYVKLLSPLKSVVGDIIIYKNNAGNIIHSAKVTMVSELGAPTEVQSKWAQHAEYRHDPNNSPYGTNWEIFRTPMANPEIGSPTIPENNNLSEIKEALEIEPDSFQIESVGLDTVVLDPSLDCGGVMLLDSRPQPPIVGGELLPIDSTALLLAGVQANALWLIPAIVAAVGIGIVIARKF